MIIISLFDEVEFDDRSSGGFLEDETATRKEKRFLGSLVLPFQVEKTGDQQTPLDNRRDKLGGSTVDVGLELVRGAMYPASVQAGSL